MKSEASIRSENIDAAAKAAKLKQIPLVAFTDGDVAVMKCPILGDYVPKGWTLKETLFVDNSGFGGNDEPALTTKQFLAKVKDGFGYAIVEINRLQVHIGVYEKTD